MEGMMNASDLVVYGTITGHIDGDPFANNFEIIDVVQGAAQDGETIPVLEYSGASGDGLFYKIDGDVDYKIGTVYLLFLGEVNGGYKANFMSLSVYEEEGGTDDRPYLAHGASIFESAYTNQVPNTLTVGYYTEPFLNHLKEIANKSTSWDTNTAGVYISDDAFTSQANSQNFDPITANRAPCPNDPPAHCTTIFGDAQTGDQTSCTANTPGAFAVNTWDVCVASGAQTDPSNANAIADLQSAITTMNSMPGVNISYTGVGTCAATCATGNAADDAIACNGGTLSNPNKMWVFFDDPCNEITDLVACEGVLGIGGSFGGFVPALCHQDACGNFFQNLDTPFFVMNNGSGCTSNYSYTAVLIHEMLHAIGVGHIGGDSGDPGTGPNQCTALMNPVVCNANDPGAPDFGLTTLDNACTDWMYNGTPATTCAITNVTLTAPAVCNGDNAEFEVCFDVVDGSGAYDIEVNGTVVTNAVAGATDGTAAGGDAVCISVVATGPTGAVTAIVNVRDDAVFSCVDDTDLQVAIPQCPPPCASNCADLLSGAATDCGNNYYPDQATYPGAGTTSAPPNGDGTGNCQDYSAVPVELGAGTGGMHTICTQYTAGTNAAAYIDFLVAGDPGCIDQSIAVFEAGTCTDVTTTGVIVTQPGGGFAGQATGLTPFDDYIVCFTYTENNCADDFSATLFEICPDIVEIGPPPCMSIQDATVPEHVCNGDDITIDFGANCMVDPNLDDPGAGNISGYGLVLYLDANGVPTTFPAGSNFTANDLLIGTPNLALTTVNSGGCADLVASLGFVNGTCDPIQVSLGVFNIDVVNFTVLPDCPIEEYIVTIHPNLEVLTVSDNNCNPEAWLLSGDGNGAFFDLDGDTQITVADACSTVPTDPTPDCTANIPYDFSAEVDANSPGCEGTLIGTLTCVCGCAANPDSPIAADVCTGEDVVVALGGACTTEPSLDDPTTPGGLSGYGVAVYLDAGGFVTTFPTNLTTDDLLIDANIALQAVNAGGCTDLTIAGGFTTSGCLPEVFDLGIFPIDVNGNFIPNSPCPIVVTTVTVFPSLTAQMVSEDPANCGDLVAALFDATGAQCAGTEMTVSCTDEGVAPVASFPADANGCYAAQDVIGTACTTCVAVPDVTITDPCSCDAAIDVCGGAISDPPGNIDLDGNGSISGTDLVADVITITVTPPTAGEVWTVSNAGDALNCDESGIAVNTVLTDVGGGVYELVVYYYGDGTGFGTMTFSGDMGSPDVSITNPSTQFPACLCECQCDADGGRF